MGSAAGAAYSKVPLRQLGVNSDGHLETGGEPEPRHNSKKSNYKKCTFVLTFMVLVLLIAATGLAVVLSGCSLAALGPVCPDDWVGYRGKCYYFSEAEGTWNNSQSHCSSLGASLAAINTLQELDFMLRCKGKFDHWIGLRRDPGQPWKWANGTEFNNLYCHMFQQECPGVGRACLCDSIVEPCVRKPAGGGGSVYTVPGSGPPGPVDRLELSRNDFR